MVKLTNLTGKTIDTFTECFEGICQAFHFGSLLKRMWTYSMAFTTQIHISSKFFTFFHSLCSKKRVVCVRLKHDFYEAVDWFTTNTQTFKSSLDASFSFCPWFSIRSLYLNERIQYVELRLYWSKKNPFF